MKIGMLVSSADGSRDALPGVFIDFVHAIDVADAFLQPYEVRVRPDRIEPSGALFLRVSGRSGTPVDVRTGEQCIEIELRLKFGRTMMLVGAEDRGAIDFRLDGFIGSGYMSSNSCSLNSDGGSRLLDES